MQPDGRPSSAAPGVGDVVGAGASEGDGVSSP
ncbi:hypothetical protein BC477_19330 [Clavibacter michiganensis subsp. michiganensis]|uniref:Uncharacterized protein n=1 Tax=Clavibacter michiganensis subsp. michiganensis TaxID=33013 RepID=A0A251XGP9_CLAMM|nr:hypothetical protein BC477_19330 [Clavibacter michiganensis subsp. michiganensis]OUE01636.1 hypothetical protein CMMCAS07_15115 [Clavibacter michiganensis subsp. michiganensis]